MPNRAEDQRCGGTASKPADVAGYVYRQMMVIFNCLLRHISIYNLVDKTTNMYIIIVHFSYIYEYLSWRDF